MKRWIDDPHLRGEEEQAKALLESVEEPRAMPNARLRVWNRLEGQKAPPRSLAWAALAGSLAGATIVGVVMISRPSADPYTVSEALEVEVDARPAIAGLGLSDAAAIKVGPSGRARLIGPELGSITLSSSTRLSLIGIETGRLSISEGRIDRQVAEPAWLTIDAGHYTVEADGQFWLARIGDDIEIEVATGQARVAGLGQKLALAAGDHYSSAKLSVVEEPKPATTIEAPAETPKAEAPIERRHSPARSRAVRRAPLVDEAPIEPGAAKVESKVEAKVDAEDTPAIPAARPAIAERPEPIKTELDWGEKYRAAQKEGVPEKAIPMFDEIANGPSPYAEVAGHQAARLVMRRGRCAEAIGRFETLLRRYPAGSYVPEGQLNVIECRLVTGDLEGASLALDRFLARNPGSERTTELTRMRDELRRRKKK